MNFRVGQKVVCVDAEAHGKYLAPGLRPKRTSDPLHGLTKGAIYTVRELTGYMGFPSIRLMEIRRPVSTNFHVEVGFANARFRPLIERKTDIGFAHEILRKHTKKQGADA